MFDVRLAILMMICATLACSDRYIECVYDLRPSQSPVVDMVPLLEKARSVLMGIPPPFVNQDSQIDISGIQSEFGRLIEQARSLDFDNLAKTIQSPRQVCGILRCDSNLTLVCDQHTYPVVLLQKDGNDEPRKFIDSMYNSQLNLGGVLCPLMSNLGVLIFHRWAYLLDHHLANENYIKALNVAISLRYMLEQEGFCAITHDNVRLAAFHSSPCCDDDVLELTCCCSGETDQYPLPCDDDCFKAPPDHRHDRVGQLLFPGI